MKRPVFIIIAFAIAGVAIAVAIQLSGGMSSAVASSTSAPLPDVAAAPRQSEPASRGDFAHATPSAEFTITPLADYDVSAQVVGVKKYRSGWMGELAPVDLALAWGRLPDPAHLKHVKFRQSDRWYYYDFSADSPLTAREISESSANTHIIPANGNIAAALRSVRRGDRVRLTGCLVSLTGRSGGGDVRWKSSLTRLDSGNQSCELMFVESIQVDHAVYQ